MPSWPNCSVVEGQQIILYESSSFGGCYEYVLQLHRHYQTAPQVTSCLLLIPRNSDYREVGVKAVLLPDRVQGPKLMRRLNFLLRNFLNPFLLLVFLLRTQKSFVLFNDFEQFSAPFWVPLFRFFLRKKHQFGIFLHDPDRDDYPPHPWWARYSMHKLMSLQDLALYHEYIPAKPYYAPRPGLTYLSVPHGIYELGDFDEDFFHKLEALKKNGRILISIPGNIRPEKNYEYLIRALTRFTECVLVIAGKPSTSGISLDQYKHLADELKVNARTVWIEKYLAAGEMAALIQASDLISLYYSASFTSQSGILHLVAPFRKPVITGKVASSLSQIVEKYGLGTVCRPDDQLALEEALERALSRPAQEWKAGWDQYLHYARWDLQVQKVIQTLHED